MGRSAKVAETCQRCHGQMEGNILAYPRCPPYIVPATTPSSWAEQWVDRSQTSSWLANVKAALILGIYLDAPTQVPNGQKFTGKDNKG